MKSWIFNDNDQITELLSGQAAIDYVASHPTAYAWRPSFTHWMPVSYIEEFISVLPVPQAPKAVPESLIENFIGKEKALVEKLGTLDGKIVNAINSLAEFNNEVDFYKDLTKDCNLDVQETLDNIEKQYARLKANLKTFTTTAASDKHEINQTTAEFNNSVNNGERTTSTKAADVELSEQTTEPDPVSPIVENTIAQEAPTETVVAPAPELALEEESFTPEKTEMNVVAERTVKPADPVASPRGNRASSSLSELVSDEVEKESAPEAFNKPKLKPVEFTEDITTADLAIAAKIQAMSNAGNKGVSFDNGSEEKVAEPAEGDFDYLLKDKYVDDGQIGTLAAANEEELVATADDSKKRRRRRR